MKDAENRTRRNTAIGVGTGAGLVGTAAYMSRNKAEKTAQPKIDIRALAKAALNTSKKLDSKADTALDEARSLLSTHADMFKAKKNKLIA